MRLAAAHSQPFRLDVAATSSIPSLLPKISVDPAVAAQGIGRFIPAIQDILRNKLKGTANSVQRRWRAVRIRMGEIDKVVG